MPFVDLVDLLTLGGDSIGLLDSLGSTGTSVTIDFSMDCILSWSTWGSSTLKSGTESILALMSFAGILLSNASEALTSVSLMEFPFSIVKLTLSWAEVVSSLWQGCTDKNWLVPIGSNLATRLSSQ